jgi:phosphonate transport system substrate-binding protein
MTRLPFKTIFLTAAAAATLTASPSVSGPVPARPTLRVSMIPTTDPGKMLRDSRPFAAYLEHQIGAAVDLTIPLNYAAVVEAIVSDQVDIAHLGGFTFVQASARAGAVPLVQRAHDRAFHSLFITQPASPIRSLADLKGHTFAFGDVNSTSGHLMPEYFMRQANVDPAVIRRALYTGGHDATALAVANGKVDAGAMDENVYHAMVESGRMTAQQVKVFWTTPPFVDYVWAARRGLDAKLAAAFSSALLALDGRNPQHKPMLDFLSATTYVRAADADYDTLRQAAKDAGLMK